MPILEAMACGTPVDRSALRRLPRLLRRRHRVPGAGAAHPAAGRAQPAVQHARVSRRGGGGRLLRGGCRRSRRRDATRRRARTARARGAEPRRPSGPGPSRGRLRSSGFASVSRADARPRRRPQRVEAVDHPPPHHLAREVASDVLARSSAALGRPRDDRAWTRRICSIACAEVGLGPALVAAVEERPLHAPHRTQGVVRPGRRGPVEEVA